MNFANKLYYTLNNKAVSEDTHHGETLSYLLRNKTGKLLITDLVGRQIYEATLTNGIAKITIKLNVASGTYICKLVDGTDTKVKKWIVIK